MKTRRTYQQLLKFYTDQWLSVGETHQYDDDTDKALVLLNTYTQQWGTSHHEAVSKLVSPYLDTKNGTPNLNRILYQISLCIPKYNPKGGLAAIFEVIEQKTCIDIRIYYGNDEIAKLRMAMNHQDSLTMQDLLKNKEIDVCKEYHFIANRKPMIPLQYLLYVGMVNPFSTVAFIRQGVDLMIATNPNCLTPLKIEQFEAFKNTLNPTWEGMDIYNNISGYLRTTLYLNNIIHFIFCCNDNSNLNVLNILPKDLITEICALAVQLSSQEDNSSLYWIKLLINEYIIKNADTELAKTINKFLEWYENLPATQHPGRFLYFLSTVVTNIEKPGFHDNLPRDFLVVLHKIHVFMQIDIQAFYQNGALTNFFYSHRDLINEDHPDCMIQMILSNEVHFPDAAKDIKLIFSHSNCFALGKRGLTQSFMEYYVNHRDGLNIVNECGGLTATTHKELLESFEFALKMHGDNNDIHWATYLFCFANNLNTPIKYIEPSHHSHRLSILIQILNEIHDQVTMMKVARCEKKIVSSELIMMLLSYTKAPDFWGDHDLPYITHTYLLLLKVKDDLADWKAVMDTFAQKHDIHGNMSKVVRHTVMHMLLNTKYNYLLDEDFRYKLMCMTTLRNFSFFSHEHSLPHDQVNNENQVRSLPAITNSGF